MNILRWALPTNVPPENRNNFLNLEIDGFGVGIANAAAPFLPVFLAHLGATNFQVGLLTSMPAITGLVLSIFLGNFLQSRRDIIPWFTKSRLITFSCYTLTGLVTLIFAGQAAVYVILLIWALATLPQAISSITFSVVMNAVAGPGGRLELMSRRWSILGSVTAISTLVAGQVLVAMTFPVNYRIVFIVLSLGGVLSYYFSSRVHLLKHSQVSRPSNQSFARLLRENFQHVRSHETFLRIVAKRFVFLTGATLAIPLFPLYYVRVVHASDAWIGIFSTAQTIVLVFGYFFWLHQSRRRNSRWILLIATFGISLYPTGVALTHNEILIALIAGASGIFQAGVDLVFFDELMKTIPLELSPSFISFDQSIQYVSAIAAPIVGTLLAGWIGLGGALLVSAVIRLAGFAWFALDRPPRDRVTITVAASDRE